jgi:DNA polymerase III epsilon subunit-like protein/cbb3-type cytochrome oxidase subunit 3
MDNGASALLIIFLALAGIVLLCVLWSATNKANKEKADAQAKIDNEASLERSKKQIEEINRLVAEVHDRYTTPQQKRRKELRDERTYYSRTYGEIAKYQHNGSRYVIFDFETSGLNAQIHSIIEIAAVRYINDEPVEKFETLVRLPKNKKLPPSISELTGITTEMLDSDGSELEQAISDFIKFIGDDCIMSYNFEFDSAFLYAACGRKIANKSRCIYKMARSKWRNRSSYKLVDLLETECMTTVTTAHRAMQDVEHAHDLLIAIAYY